MLIGWTLSLLGWNGQVVKRSEQCAFKVLSKRWSGAWFDFKIGS